MISIKSIVEEIQTFLRNSNIISVSDREVTTGTDTFIVDDSTSEFSLKNTGVKNVRLVIVNGSSMNFGDDYSVTYPSDTRTGSGIVHLTDEVDTGTVEIKYDYSHKGDRIYADYPREEIAISKYPRIGFDIISSNTGNLNIGAKNQMTNMVVSIKAFADKKDEVDNMMDTMRKKFITNSKKFYNFPLITIQNIYPLRYEDPKGKIVSRTGDFKLWFMEENLGD